MEYKAKPEYEKCVAISTEASIREMIAPGAIALITPVIVGFIFGPEVLGGLLAGVTVSGVLMGMFQSNAGGAWDNAKKSFEKGVEIDGEMFYKKSEPHKASVTGDTVGDPFKDTSGPSMNILIKLMSIVALVIAPHISEKGHAGEAHGAVVLTTTNDSLSFALGLAIGDNFHNLEIDSLINYRIFEKAANGASGMELEEAQMFMESYMQRKEIAKSAPLRKKEQEFFDANKNAEGVVVAESGTQYKIINQGTGIFPSDTDAVTLNFKATSLDGMEELGNTNAGPKVSPFNQSILSLIGNPELLKEGGKVKLFVQAGVISDNAAIIELELVKVSK
jgi:FKBP-type peptidyl-prolyl cis-trans isomerase